MHNFHIIVSQLISTTILIINLLINLIRFNFWFGNEYVLLIMWPQPKACRTKSIVGLL